jgi:tetratricopeptide (TPR) repeat protein
MERSSKDEEVLDDVLYHTPNRLGDMDIRGIIDQQQELKYRLALVQALHGQYQARRNPRDLFAAIDHAQVVIRRLPASPAEKVKMLSSLSWMKMSVFFLQDGTPGAPLLEDAIAYARAAITTLTEANINDDEELEMAYDCLGQALSAKAQKDGDFKALNEAIDCGRQTVRLAKTGDAKAEQSVNVAVRLHMRYLKTRQEADVNEALETLTKSLETLPPNCRGHGASLLARGAILYEMHRQSGDLETLDKAIADYVQGFESIPPTHDRFIDVLRSLGELHEMRYEKTSEISELRSSLGCYARAVAEAPNHSMNIDFICHQLKLLRRIADAQTKLLDIEPTLKQAQLLFDRVPPNHDRYMAGANNTSHILARRYFMTRHLFHLKALVMHVLNVGEKTNKSIHATRSGSRVDLTPVHSLRACLNKFPERLTEKDVLDKIFEYFSIAHNSSGPTNGVINMYRNYGVKLELLCMPADEQAPSASSFLGPESKTVLEKDAGIVKRLGNHNPPRQSRDPYTDPITGMRYLAATPGSGTLMMTMEGIVRNLMGYDDDHPDPRTHAEHVAREARLEAETLEREKQEGKNPNPALCRVCRRIEPLIRSATNDAISWNTKLMLPHGNWHQLKCRSHCVICSLILSLVAVDPNDPQELHPRLTKIDPEVQGVQFEIQELDDAGETILGVRYGMIYVGALRIVSSRNRRGALRDGGSGSGFGLGRVDVSKVQNWMSHCESIHGKKCSSYFSNKRCKQPIPLMFIDVVNQCLVRATSAERYFALSYVWGGPQTMATTKSNVESRFKTGSLTESNCRLPQTIRDAMTWVGTLGERYLWVDSMCIVQDDAEVKDRDIHRMDIVYMMAFATIAAAHGKNADAGLSGLRPGSRHGQRTVSLSLPSPSDGVASEQVLLTTTPVPLLFALESTMWETRGWVLQEHLLSRRCLFFTSNWVYFQCGQEVVSETAMRGRNIAPGPKMDKEPRLQENVLSILAAKTGLVTEQQRLYRAFEAYTKLVDIYVCRNLTEYNDIVNAFTGILGVFEEHFAGAFIGALPTAALDLALLWTPGQKMLNRTPFISDPKDPESHRLKPYFPSWSWAGWVPWVGRPGYGLFGSMSEQNLPTPMIDIFQIQHDGVFHSIAARGTAGVGVLNHETKQRGVSGPDWGPDVLQFWADTVDPSNFPFITDKTGWVMPEKLSLREHVHTQTSQAVIRLQDRDGRHCGLWCDNKNHRLWWRGEREKEQPRMELVAVSRMIAVGEKDGERRLRGPYRVEGEIELFDRAYFADEGPEGGVVNCLVLEWYDEIASRVTMAQVHWKAWKAARPKRKHIRLI